MKKSLLLLLLCTGLLTGCGNQDMPAEPTETSTVSQTTTEQIAEHQTTTTTAGIPEVTETCSEVIPSVTTTAETYVNTEEAPKDTESTTTTAKEDESPAVTDTDEPAVTSKVKKAKNNGERAMYLASDCHPAIIDRNTYNLVQQELARRSAKRKVSTKTVTEQGKYSSKYALTELMICGECGTPYRRCTWNVHGKKQIVWRCISRLDHGSKYCKASPTIHEEPLQRAIVQAINDFYDCGDDVAKVLKANVESVLAGMEQTEIQRIEDRLKEIDKARNDIIGLITNGSCDEDAMDAEFAKLFEEETQLSQKLLSLKAQCKVSDDTKEKIDSTIAEIENNRFQLEAFDDVLIRKLIECIKVLSKTEILIIFKGGYEVKTDVEKK